MNYMQQVDAWLDSISITGEHQRKEIKAKILESFKNGKGMRYAKGQKTSERTPQAASAASAV